MKNGILFPLLFSLLVLAGCGDKVPLKGKVVFSDDGSPLTAGRICLTTDTYFSRGEIKPDGTFVVGSEKATDGLPPGTYRVYIAGAEKLIGEDEMGKEVTESIIDPKYASAETSGIVVDVTPSTKSIEIIVDRFDPKKK